MATLPSPIICPECNLLPTQHRCGHCDFKYVCGSCSQRRGVPEGVFRCKKCAPKATNDQNEDVFHDAADDITPSPNDERIDDAPTGNVYDDAVEGVGDPVVEQEAVVPPEEAKNDEGNFGDCDESVAKMGEGNVTTTDNVPAGNAPEQAVAPNKALPEEGEPIAEENKSKKKEEPFVSTNLERPKRMNKNLGRNAIISVLLKNCCMYDMYTTDRRPNGSRNN